MFIKCFLIVLKQNVNIEDGKGFGSPQNPRPDMTESDVTEPDAAEPTLLT
jgi:hypothetical protein